ncbi:hypothetical protein [Nostoc sp. 'Peltigera membranacea cyanobiont' 232]|uniref:hypothetical protein n=1 Tax=Nostoc sp. 'Peltigera membranacea cyanobiont' 232 TaxID=2014531 RepID=UPI000B95C0CC|nr:hypothetical protein [Nostoc sp. 'Peltigera membranacea cyanobiont' 232]OYD99314.1 hypothetical protein CDG79_39745 [Nostoc sp. 'Peltigera membranacea cyanobiont' 232]
MNTQEIQEILNHLIIGITALYAIVMLVDFVVGIVHLWHEFTLNVESYTNNTTSEQSHIESSDIKKSLNWENQNQSTNRITSKPEPQPNNFVSIDVDKIDLRTARKIATAIKKASKSNPDLIIKQKVNNKCVPLAWLQAQIKHRLELAPEIVTPIIRELAPTALTSVRENIQHSNIAKTDKRQVS